MTAWLHLPPASLARISSSCSFMPLTIFFDDTITLRDFNNSFHGVMDFHGVNAMASDVRWTSPLHLGQCQCLRQFNAQSRGHLGWVMGRPRAPGPARSRGSWEDPGREGVAQSPPQFLGAEISIKPYFEHKSHLGSPGPRPTSPQKCPRMGSSPGRRSHPDSFVGGFFFSYVD